MRAKVGGFGERDGTPERRVSKAEGLDLAKSYIEELEKKHLSLKGDNEVYKGDMQRLEEAWAGVGV